MRYDPINKRQSYLPALFPKEGKFRDYMIKQELLRLIAISDAEKQRISRSENPEAENIQWDHQTEEELEIELTKVQQAYLRVLCEKTESQTLPDDV